MAWAPTPERATAAMPIAASADLSECIHGLEPSWCATCLGPAIPPKPKPTTKARLAKYESKACKSCGEPIDIGTKVRQWDDDSWRHDVCS